MLTLISICVKITMFNREILYGEVFIIYNDEFYSQNETFDDFDDNDTLEKIKEHVGRHADKNHLNIGLFTDTFTPDINGVSVSVATLRNELIKMGHNVYVVAPSLDTKLSGTTFSEGILRMPAVKLTGLYGYRLARPYSLKALSYIKAMNLDVIHNNTEFSMRILANVASAAYNIPYVYTYHTLWEDYTYYINKGYFDKSSRKLVGLYTKHIANNCDEVIVPTEKTARILRTYKVCKSMHVIPTGIDTERLHPDHIDKVKLSELRRKYGLENSFCMCYVGRIAKEKNMDFVLDCVGELKQKIPEFKFVITGLGPAVDEMKAHSEKLGQQDYVIFTGKQPSDQIQYFYALGDFFCTASTSETQGLTYIEAMASGCPVIAKRDECLNNVLIDGVNGFAFDTEEELIDSVVKFHDMTEQEKEKMKKKAIEKADEFSSANFAKKVLSVYYEAIKNGRKGQNKNINDKVKI